MQFLNFEILVPKYSLMKQLTVILFLLFYSLQNLTAQVITQINTNAKDTAKDISIGINLNTTESVGVLQTYLEYESKLNTTPLELLTIKLQKNIKLKLTAPKFLEYLAYTNQEDLTAMDEGNTQSSPVTLSGDNANPNPPLTYPPVVNLSEK